MKLALCAAVVVASFCATGCGEPPRRRRAEARLEQSQLDRIAQIPIPQRRLAMVGRVLIETADGGNARVAQEIFQRFPGLVLSPAWPGFKAAAIARASAKGHDDIVRLIQAQDASRTALSSLPPLPAQAAEPPAAPPKPKPAPIAPALDSDVDEPSYHDGERPDAFALVVGIEKYSALPDARFAERDADAVHKHLVALGVPERNIVVLKGGQATRGKLQGYLREWLPKNVKPDSSLFVYFSGHGAPDPASGDAYLVPWDGDARFLQSTAYPLKDFYASLQSLHAKATVVALDACFSGAGGRSVLPPGARPLVTKTSDAGPGPGVTVLAAASSDEITGTLDGQGHGVFTYFLLKGLNKGSRTTSALFGFLKPRVQDEAHRQNREQTPALQGDDQSL